MKTQTITDKLQSKQIRLLFGLVAFLGGASTLLLYFQRRKNSKEEKELLALDKELKELQLRKLKSQK